MHISIYGCKIKAYLDLSYSKEYGRLEFWTIRRLNTKIMKAIKKKNLNSLFLRK